MKLSLLVIGAAVLVVGCMPPKDANGNTIARIPTDSTAYYREQFEQATAISHAKDSLVMELSEVTRLVADVNTELATIKGPAKTVTPVVAGEAGAGSTANARTEVLDKVKGLTARVKRSEARLATSQRRLRALTSQSDSMKVVLAAYATSIADLQSLVDAQKVTIETMTAELEQVKGLNEQLATSNAELVDTVGAMESRENTVYYVIGKKKDLLNLGLVVEEGGTRFLIFTRTGETLRPAETLDSTLFIRADRRNLTEIPMPNPKKDYRLVSRQDLAFAAAPTMKEEKFRGALEIQQPVEFWGPSRYLIIVEN